MKLQGSKSNLFDTFEQDAVRGMHLFIGGIYPCSSLGASYNNDHCGAGSENSLTCRGGHRDDPGTVDSSK